MTKQRKPTREELEIDRDYYKKNLATISIFCVTILVVALLGWSAGLINKYKVDKLQKENLALKEQIDSYELKVNCVFEFSDSNGITKINQTSIVTFNKYEGYKDFLEEMEEDGGNCEVLK